MKKLVIVYNPKSSNYQMVKSGVLVPVRKLNGYLVGKYEVKPKSVRENAEILARLLSDGDLVVVAGGDGTATMVVNAVIESGKQATLAVLGYGNFNDMARTMNTCRASLAEVVEGYENGKIATIYPLEVKTDGELWRYAPCYVTMGLFAESTRVFNEEKVRGKLTKKRLSRRVFSWMTLAKWYFKNRRGKDFLPEFLLNGKRVPAKTTDYVAMNARRMAGVMRGRDWLLQKEVFASATAKLGSFGNLMSLMVRSVLMQTPVKETRADVVEFLQPASVELHSEGEYERVEGVQKVEIRKAEKCLTIVKL